MMSVSQTPQLDVDQPQRRIPPRRTTIRRLGFAAAGVAVAILVSGRAFAAPTPLHTNAPGCMTAGAGQPNGKQWPAPPAMTINQHATYTASLETNCGTITAALNATKAPQTVNSFVFLAGQQYFDQHPLGHRLTTERDLRPAVRRPDRHR